MLLASSWWTLGRFRWSEKAHNAKVELIKMFSPKK